MKTKHFPLAFLLALCIILPLPAHASARGQVQYDLGVYALDEDNLSAARSHFLAAISESPANPYYHHQLGKTYLKSGRPEEATLPLETAFKLNPSISGLQFDLGMAYYETGRYSDAEDMFGDLTAEEPGNVLARYYLGMSLFKQDKYGRALPPLLQSGDENVSIRDNSYYFAGISHYKTDQPTEALDKLDYVENKASSEKLRQSARRWQEVIRTQQARSARYNLYLKTALEYDDNVRLEPVNADLGADGGDFVASAYFSGQYKFINSFSRKVGVGYSHFQTRHFDISEFDMVAGVFSLFYQERFTERLYISLRYDPSYYLVDYENYMQRHQLSPSLLFRFNETAGLRFSYDYTNSNYFTDKGRSGQGYRLGADFFSLLFANRAELTLGIDYSAFDTDHPDFDRDHVRYRFELLWRLPEDFKFAVKAYKETVGYDNLDSSSAAYRDDDKYSWAFELSHPFYRDWLQVHVLYRYTSNESNIESYSYDKNVTGLALSAKF